MILYAASLEPAERTNWELFVPLLLGIMSILYLLPRPSGRSLRLGSLLGVLAVGAFGYLLVAGMGGLLEPNPETVLFTAFSLLAITFAAMMITQINPAHSAICFAVVVLSVCGLFLLNAAPFLMAATVIIYGGAIIVTFLFVIMLSQQYSQSDANNRSREPFGSAAVGFILLGTLLVGVQRVHTHTSIDTLVADLNAIAASEDYAEVAKIAGVRGKDVDSRLVVRLRDASKHLGLPATPDKTRLVPAYFEEVTTFQERELSLKTDLLDNKPTLLKEIRDDARELASTLATLKAMKQSGEPAVRVTLSEHSVAKPVPDRDRSPYPPRQLPAANVSALGRSLFTDHLLAVELAGTLLLVATIGAILIAGRRERGTVS